MLRILITVLVVSCYSVAECNAQLSTKYVTRLFEGEESSGKLVKGYVFYDPDIPLTDSGMGAVGRDITAGNNGGSGIWSADFQRGNISGTPLQTAHYEDSFSVRAPASTIYYDSVEDVGQLVMSTPGGEKWASISKPPRRLTVNDIFNVTPTHKSISYVLDGPKIKASFKPFGGAMSLAEAALLLEVDHFNWLQTLSGPGNWSWKTYHDPKVSEIFDNRNQVIGGADVISNPSPRYDLAVQRKLSPEDLDRYVVSVDGNSLNDVKNFVLRHPYRDDNKFNAVGNPILDGPSADDQPYYYSEDNAPKTSEYEWELAQNGPFTLDFSDYPRVPDYALSGTDGVAAPNFYFSFVTELVGVKADGSIKHFNVPNTTFKWKSNAALKGTKDEVTGGIKNIIAWMGTGFNGGEPASSGGVFDVAYVEVPEPHSIILVSTAMFLALWCRSTKV